MGVLRAVRAPATTALTVLRHHWETGDAVAFLDPNAPDASVAELLEVLRPATLTDLDAHGRAETTELGDAGRIDDDVALVVATSGSTGTPKGVELTHDALSASTRASLARLGAVQGDRWALALPTYHIAGIAVHLRAAANGTDVVEASSPTALARVEAEHVSLVPTQLARLLDAGVDVSRFRSVLLGGAAADGDLLRRAEDAGARLTLSYGMSETCGGCVYDGEPLDGVDVEVVDGRIRIRGPMRFARYRRDVAATAAVLDADGWFTTGDLGRLVDGRLVIDGRADDVAVTGGENVPLAAVTRLLLEHPSIHDAAVTTRPHRTWGDELVAVVVADDVTLDDVKAFVRTARPAAWAPRALVTVDELPRDDMGKLSERRLRALARSALPEGP